jgi:hypothetical protein
MTVGAMLTHLTKPFDTSGKSAARRYHRSACTSFAFQQALRIAYGAARPTSALNILP